MFSRAPEIYLDHNATTPIDPGVLAAMEPYLRHFHGNPSSAHRLGRQAREGIDVAREQVARLLGCQPAEVIFTSGGSEANALAILGYFRALGKAGHFVTSPTEHPAVLTAGERLATEGHRVTLLAVDPDGVVEKVAMERVLENGGLLSLMLANNETGVVQPVGAMASLARSAGMVVHCDAVQAIGKIPVKVDDLGVDLLSLAGHKFYGPKGIGALYVKKGTNLSRLLSGGHQERDLRPGTENVAGIVGLGTAAALVTERLERDHTHLLSLREQLWTELSAQSPQVVRNTPQVASLPNTLHVSFPGLDSEGLVIGLDLEGVYVSGGAACASGAREPSHVLAAMNMERERALGSLRLTLGRYSTAEDVSEAARRIARVVEDARRAHDER